MLDTTNLLRCETWCCYVLSANRRAGVVFCASPTNSLLAAAADDEHIGPLIVTRLVATRRLTPRGDRMTAARGLTFTTTVRVVDRVHRDTAVGRANALPAVASRLTDGDVLVIRIANLADRRHALDQNLAGLAGGQLQKSVIAFLRDQVHLRAGRAGHLRALARTQLDVVHDRTGRDELQRQRVANQDIGLGAAHDLLSDLESDGLDDVAL